MLVIRFFKNNKLVPMNIIPFHDQFHFEDYTDIICNFYMNTEYAILHSGHYFINKFIPININNIFIKYIINFI